MNRRSFLAALAAPLAPKPKAMPVYGMDGRCLTASLPQRLSDGTLPGRAYFHTKLSYGVSTARASLDLQRWYTRAIEQQSAAYREMDRAFWAGGRCSDI